MTDTPKPLSAKRLADIAAVTDGHRRAGYDRVLVHLDDVDALIAEVKRLRATIADAVDTLEQLVKDDPSCAWLADPLYGEDGRSVLDRFRADLPPA